MYAEGGDKSYLHHHAVSISNFFARMGLLLGRFWVSGPTIPIIILFSSGIRPRDEDNLIAALEHPDCVSRIKLSVDESQLGKIAALMQEPLPLLTHLSISSHFGNVSALPDGFLGGSAPSLHELELCDVRYQALPTLLSSAGNLVNLTLRNIPPTGYVSPEAMASLVATTLKLEILEIDFNALMSFPDLILSPPTTRTILPILRKFLFSGECKYLEDFVSRIDIPSTQHHFGILSEWVY
jgi:hypothetical protein